jgi:outer membrane protein assembly factor BamB
MERRIIERGVSARNLRGRAALVALALAAGLSSRPPAVADDWPAWLGPHGDNSSRETGWLKDWPDAGPPRLFERTIGEGYSAVAVAAGRLILFHRLADDLVVEALDPLSGKGQWEHRYPTDYVDRYGYNGGPRCSPVIDLAGAEKQVFTLGPKGILYALRLADGAKRWRRDLLGEFKVEPFFFGVGAAPVIDGRRLIVNVGGTEADTGVALAFDKDSGELLWKTPTGGGGYAAARVAEIAGARHVFIFHRTGLSSLDPESGRKRWTYLWHSKIYDSVNATTPVIAGDIVFISAAYRTGSSALRVKDGSYDVLWKDDEAAREKIMESHWSNVNLVGKHLYGFSGRHEAESRLVCVELETGKVAWRWDGGLGRGSMLHADGRFIALGERGDLALLELSPAGHTVHRQVQGLLSAPAWTPPVLAGGVLYLRDEKKLIALDLRAGADLRPKKQKEAGGRGAGVERSGGSTEDP